MTTARQLAVENLKSARAMTEALLKDFPADKLTYQSHPSDNHALWMVGHLGTAYLFFAGLIDGKPYDAPERMNTLFGYGSKPTADREAYPELAEIEAFAKKAYGRLLAAAESLTAADEFAKPAGDASFVSSKVDAVMKAAWHEGWHGGQVAALRKALGLKNLM